jgi:hypothetical protein
MYADGSNRQWMAQVRWFLVGLGWCILAASANASVTINFIYGDEVTQTQRAAMGRAASLWSSWLASDATLQFDISVSFKPLGGTTLAQSDSTAYILNNNLMLTTTQYQNLTGTYDMASDGFIEFDSTRSWYDEGDTQPIGSRYDLMSVALHEVGHILGMTASYTQGFTIAGVQYGGWGKQDTSLPGFPYYLTQWDSLLRDKNNNPPTPRNGTGIATDSFNETGAVTFIGDNAKAANNGNPLPVYAPSTYNAGSSLTHPDASLASSFLMNYQYTGVVHGLYDFELAAFTDLGWKFNSPTLARTNGDFLFSGGSNTGNWNSGALWTWQEGGQPKGGLPPTGDTDVYMDESTEQKSYYIDIQKKESAKSLTIAATANLVLASNLSVTNDISNDGTILLDSSGSASLSAKKLFIGKQGSGNVQMNGGAMICDYVYVASDFNTTGAFILNNGTATLGYLSLGWGGNGTWTQSGGTLDVRNYNIDVGGAGPGTFHLNGGLVIADEVNMGSKGVFTGTGAGTLRVNTINGSSKNISLGNLQLGHDGGSKQGQITINSGDSLTINGDETVAWFQDSTQWIDTTAKVVQTGGTHTIQGNLTFGAKACFFWIQPPGYYFKYLAYASTSSGSYELLSGSLEVNNEDIGGPGSGIVTQSGGSHVVHGKLRLGFPKVLEIINQNWESPAYPLYVKEGRYYLNNGSLSVGTLEIGYDEVNTFWFMDDTGWPVYDDISGPGQLVWSGGTLTCNNISIKRTGIMEVSHDWSYNGQLKINLGKLSMPDSCLTLGNIGSTTLTFNSGELIANQIVFGPNLSLTSGSGAILTANSISGMNNIVFNGQIRLGQTGGRGSGSQSLASGQKFTLNNLILGYGSSDTLTINGGALSVSGSVQIGGDGTGQINLSGGSLSASTILLGTSGPGQINIVDATSIMTVSSKLSIGNNGSLSAVPNSTIHMTGSAFENTNTNSDALAGLSNLKMIVEGGNTKIDPFEVAGKDLGCSKDGYVSNFALGTLQIGGVLIGKIQLVDVFDNQSSWSGHEALYVTNLILGSGSSIDLNGLDLYYLGFTNSGGTVLLNGGQLLQVPEPSTIVLFGMFFVGLFAYAWRRRAA